MRAKRRESIAQLDALVQSTFLEMFGDSLTNPKRWEACSLRSALAVGPQNGLYCPSKDYGSGTRILRIDGFDDGRVHDLTRLKRVDIDRKTIEKYQLSEGEIIVNRVNSRSHLGKCALLPVMDEAVVFESNMMRLRLDGERLLGEYAIHALQSRSVRAQIQRSAKDAVNQASINQTDVCGLEVLCPPPAAPHE